MEATGGSQGRVSRYEQNPLKGNRILVVDDEDGFRMFVNDILSDHGYAVTEANSGEDALRKVHEKEFDLLITDIKMPGMSGLELLCKVKMSYPNVEVIVISGSSDPEFIEYSKTHGAADFIVKSLQFDRLLLSVVGRLQNRRLNCTLPVLRRQISLE